MYHTSMFMANTNEQLRYITLLYKVHLWTMAVSLLVSLNCVCTLTFNMARTTD